LHTSPIGGHSGFLKTYHRIKKDFFWEGLKTDVQNFVFECVVFQQNKGETIKTPGLLQPLAIPSQCWEEVSMDFITGLPKSEGKTVIMVVVDRLTKYAHFFSLSHPFKASTIATTFMEIVQKLHGVPKIIVSDRDPIFTGNFWTELFSCLGTQLAHNSSYHPQYDGKTEIVNKCLEGYLHVALHMINKHNGSSGFPWQNGGTTHPSILHKKCPHFWHFMDIILHPSHHP
jgi:hypothetical protein